MTKGSNKAPDTRALYRKYRSKSLDEIVGQEHITELLRRSLASGRVAHAYLLTGPRGVGKTSIARILAHEINGLTYDETAFHPDIIEIDAASNRRIDDIRDLRDKVAIAPTSAKYKVYIIDEVHMLTGESFNAFLKTLEEPPEHVVFILATTDVHKLPATITSRTQRFSFRAISPKDASRHLRAIADKEKIVVDDEALQLIAERGGGSFRDSISLLDQVAGLSATDTPITRQVIETMLGLAPAERITQLIAAIDTHDQAAVITVLHELASQGVRPADIAAGMMHQLTLKAAESTRYVQLLDTLIEVGVSPRPDIALLVAVLRATGKLPAKSVGTVVAAEPDLALLATAAEQTQLHTTASEPSKKQHTARVAPHVVVPPATKPQPPQEKQPAAAPKHRESATPASFEWEPYVAWFRQGHTALTTILVKCKGEVHEGILHIYAGTAFWKKKLDSAKYQQLLHDGLLALGVSIASIETIPTTMPPKDSQAAAVAAIMGGGEEVEL